MKSALLSAVAALAAMGCASQVEAQSQAGEGNLLTSPKKDVSTPVPTTAPSASVAAGNQAAVQEVVVTATRETTTLSKTPAAVTALSTDQLVRSGVTDVMGLQNVVPDLSVGDQFGVNRTFIRGIGLTSIDLGADSSVAFLQDGAIISRPAAQLAGFYDVDQVEVLRGPQGTLYGRGATGGAINVITKPPTNTPDGYIKITGGNYDESDAEAAFGGPLIQDKLLGRVAIDYQHHSGYGVNLYDGVDVDNLNSIAGRVELTYKIKPDLSATLEVESYNQHDNDYAFHYFGPTIVPDNELPHALVGGKSIFDYYAALGEPVNFRNIYSGTDPINRRNEMDGTLTIDWRPDAFDLKSITSYHHFARRNVDDLSVSDASAGEIYGTNDYHEKSDTFSEDLIGSFKANTWNSLFGFSYFHENNFGSVFVPTTNIALVLDPTDMLPAATRAAIDNGEYLQTGTVYTDAYGAFVQGTYDILSNLKFTAGVRYSYEQRRGVGSFIFTPLGADVPTDQQKGWGAWTPKFTLDYQMNPKTLFYATVERGFRSGVIDIGSTNPVINPEYVWDYEGGVKIRSFENRLNSALSIFYYDYTNLQVGFVNAESIVETINAASARNYGAEFETHAAITRAFSLDFYATYLNAKFTNFADFDYRTDFSPVNLAGKTLPNAPEWTFRAAGNYDVPLRDLGGLSFHAEANYQSRVYFTEFNNSDATQGARTIIDAFVRYSDPSGHWTLDLWGKNLTDKLVIANNIVAAALFGYPRVGSLLPPRTFGATLGYKF